MNSEWQSFAKFFTNTSMQKCTEETTFRVHDHRDAWATSLRQKQMLGKLLLATKIDLSAET
jgi:hypothetical protein